MDENAVKEFLDQFFAIVQEEGLSPVPRAKNEQSLIDLGLTKEQRKQLLLELTVQDYYRGPSRDLGRKGEVWEFGIFVEEREVYIKLKIAEVKPVGQENIERKALCISFHQAERAMEYPFKKRTGKE